MLDQRIKRAAREDIRYHELEDGAVIYDTRAEKIHTLNLTAAYVWNRLDGLHTLDEIASQIRQLVDVSQETVLKDVHDVVRRYRDEGLLQSR